MNLSSLEVEPRVRNSYETADLGVLLVNRYGTSIYFPWIVVLLLFYGLIQCTAPWLSINWRWFLFWWMLPAIEPVVLHVLSVRVFGGKVKTREVLKATPRIIWKGGWWIYLTFLRLSPKRSQLQPVYLLEGGVFSKTGRRRYVLTSGEPGLSWVTIAFAHAEGLVYFLLISFILWMFPTGWFDERFLNMDDPMALLQLQSDTLLMEASFAIYLLTVMWIRPYYTAAGFVCYLTRRVKLEGWDIELQLRSLVQRLSSAAKTAILMLALVISSGEIKADGSPTPAEKMEEILTHEEFSTTREQEFYFDFDWMDEEEEDIDLSWDSSLDFSMGTLIKVISVILIGWLLIYLILKFRTHLPDARSDEGVRAVKETRKTSKRSLSMDSPDSQLSMRVEEALRNGDHRLALSLLYRSTALNLQASEPKRFHDRMTEGELLRAARYSKKKESIPKFLPNLVRLWSDLAYGHREISSDSIVTVHRDYVDHYKAKEEAV